MRKVAVIGSAGSGKSTLSRQLGEIAGIEVIHLDRLYWRKGWIEPPKEEWDALIEKLIHKDSWIMDGHYGRTMDIRMAAADTVIFLDLPRILCVYRAIKRRVQYQGRSRPDMAEGCKEKIDLEFLKWIWDFPIKKRPKILNRLKELQKYKRIIHLRSRRDAVDFLNKIRRGNLDERAGNQYSEFCKDRS